MDKSKAIGGLISLYNRYYVVFWIVFALLALRASYYSFLGALESSLDMQGYPAVQLWTSGGGGSLLTLIWHSDKEIDLWQMAQIICHLCIF